MKCDAFETRMNDILDARGAIENDVQLAEHAATCGECRSSLAAHVQLIRAVQQLSYPQPSADLAERALAEWRRPTVSVAMDSGRRVAAWYAWAAAAALLLAAWPMIAWWSSSSTVDVAQVAPSPAELASADAAPVVPLDQLLRDASDKFEKLAGQTGEPQSQAVRPVPPPQFAAASVDPAVQALTTVSWMQEVSDGLKPITNSTTEAFSFLLQAFHTNEARTRS